MGCVKTMPTLPRRPLAVSMTRLRNLADSARSACQAPAAFLGARRVTVFLAGVAVPTALAGALAGAFVGALAGARLAGASLAGARVAVAFLAGARFATLRRTGDASAAASFWTTGSGAEAGEL
jgi:hypothetical protein